MRRRRRAQRRSRMPEGHRRRRRTASWTAASTAALSMQRRTTIPRRARVRMILPTPPQRRYTPATENQIHPTPEKGRAGYPRFFIAADKERWRAAPGRARQRVEGLPADDWTPGALPPEIAATVILVCVKFLGAESDIGLSGMTWDRRVLADGEGAPINAATLLWHLTHAEGETLHQMFGHPSVQPFSALLSALSADAKRVAAAHEERRRRWMEVERRAGSRDRAGTATWKRRELASPRYAPSRFMPFNCPFRPAPLPSCTRDAAAAAVALALTTEPTNETADLSRYAGSLFGNRYIHFWLLRHLHRPPDDLINVLTQAVDVSRARDRGIILPEMPRDQMRGSVIAPDNQHLSMAD